MEDEEETSLPSVMDDPLIKTCRSALLEEENARLKSAIHLIRKEVSSHEGDDETLSKIKSIVDGEEISKESGLHRQNVLSQVRAELEHERRVRTQAALDEAERRCYQLTKELEHKASLYDDKIRDLEKTKERLDGDVEELRNEKSKLENLIRLKEEKLADSESRAKELINRANEFEILFNGQLEAVKTLQSDLAVAYDENKALVSEMEMLNEMFHELEKTHVHEALKDYEDKDSEEVEALQNVLDEEYKDSQEHRSDPTSCCFKEVTTKNGTRMILSVSKTFMKLKDLILEKKTLEDQVEKMKKINLHLADKVNLHEAKLFNITDELNKTWTYVSTLKSQHTQLHTSEQVLRAELAEKRQLLAKLREELEYSRQSWNIVKQKTAESEKEWKSLRDEFAARRMAFKPFHPTASTSSESGYSDRETPETPTKEEKTESFDIEEPEVEVEKEEEEEESKETDENCSIEEIEVEKEEEKEETAFNMSETTGTEEPINRRENSDTESLVLIMSLDYLSRVPSSPLLSEKDTNYQEIYQKLIESTNRSAAIANRLAELNRTLEADIEDEEPKEEDDHPREDSNELENEDEDCIENPFGSGLSLNEYIERRRQEFDGIDALLTETISETSSSYNDNFSSCVDIEDDLEDTSDADDQDDDEEEFVDGIENFEPPTPPPLPSFSLVPPPAGVTVRPTFEDDSSSNNSNEEDLDQMSENATTVTRFLIKHLPKQLAKLRSDKTELEDKIRGLETRISDQTVAMSEMERRAEVYKKEAQRCNALMTSDIDQRNNGGESSSRESSTKCNNGKCVSKVELTVSDKSEGVVASLTKKRENDEEKEEEDSLTSLNSIVLGEAGTSYILTLNKDEDENKLICKIDLKILSSTRDS